MMRDRSRTAAVRAVRTSILLAAHVLIIAAAVYAQGADTAKNSSSWSEKKMANESRKQKRRVYTLLDYSLRICIFAFLSAVFAGLTLGVMCANIFTLEIIAESGPMPDCKYAATVLPLRRQGHKTLCTLIISNMLCNVLIVQEFSDVFDVIEAIRTRGSSTHVVDDSGSALWKFAVSTLVIVLFAEILPMSICRSKHSLRVAAAGSIFVKVAMILTYPLSASLGWFLDLVVGGEETGQLYDKKELRKLMVMHYEREGGDDDSQMAKSELKLLLAAMDFHERKVRDIMSPIEKVACVRDTDLITTDFLEMLWKSGRSRLPVESAPGVFESVLVVKDLMTVNTSTASAPLTVAQVLKTKDRLFAMVCASTSLPSMLKFFLEAQTHMAMVFEEERWTSAAAAVSTGAPDPDVADSGGDAASVRSVPLSHPHVVGIVTMEDVVEELLASEIYDEYDRYDPVERAPQYAVVEIPGNDLYPGTLKVPREPETPPRVNFYSYFTHPKENIPLTDSQVWAVAYFLNCTVRCFYGWTPPFIKLLLDECGDVQLCAPTPSAPSSMAEQQRNSYSDGNAERTSAVSSPSSLPLTTPTHPPFLFKGDHTNFLQTAADAAHVLYASGVHSDRFVLVLGGRVELLVGPELFISKLQSFNYIGEEALTKAFFVPDYSAVVMSAARVYSIPKSLFEKYLSYQSMSRHRGSNVRIFGPGSPTPIRLSTSRPAVSSSISISEQDDLLGRCSGSSSSRRRQYGSVDKKAV